MSRFATKRIGFALSVPTVLCCIFGCRAEAQSASGSAGPKPASAIGKATNSDAPKPIAGQTETQKIPMGEFTFSIPSGWTPFPANEREALAQSVRAQAKQIYQRYNGSADSSRTSNFIAFHTHEAGTFVAMVFAIPPRADLIGDLRREAPEKAKWGIQQGFIKSASPVTSFARNGFNGFYLETISSKGSHDFTGGLVHSKRKNDVIGLMFMGGAGKSAPAVFQNLLASVSLKSG